MISKFFPYLICLFAIAGLIVCGSHLFNNFASDYENQNRVLSNLADKRIRKISEALEEEKKQHEAIMKRMQEEYERNKAVYEQRIIDLEKKKTKEVSSFVNSYGDDPTAMANSLSSVTGFKIYNEK